MSYLSWILIGIASKITRRLFIRETKKLSKKLGIPLWKVQALIIGGFIVCVGGIWYVYTKGYSKGLNEGIKEGVNLSRSSIKSKRNQILEEGAWKAVDEIAKMEPGNKFIEYLDELGVIVKDKYEYFETIYDKAPWGFGGEWD